MSFKQKRRENRQVQYLPVRRIRAAGVLSADREDLQSLADSVALYGVLQPLSVRETPGGWELLSGEKRLWAAKKAGMDTVPCLVAEDGAQKLVEALQRKDLHYLEQARLLQRLMEQRHLSQQAAAELLGLSQSAVANKLRLLRHPEPVLEILRQTGLTQRHARALLLAPEAEREALARQAARENWSVARLEKGLAGGKKPAYTAFEELLRQLGLTGDRQETETEVVFTVHLPKMA